MSTLIATSIALCIDVDQLPPKWFCRQASMYQARPQQTSVISTQDIYIDSSDLPIRACLCLSYFYPSKPSASSHVVY